ncbi:clostripain-related cysteine peptidase [Parapedobacter deserti]|uniref:Clostripain-related cysteine peptidase n=1 Tax=Parapedobacter deserti TaxID=1912957 RepID=A0ABV7JHC8_9SPHI
MLFTWGCNKDSGNEPDLPNRTVLYYLGGDNNLAIEADEKIEALRRGFPGGKNRLVIYRDTDNEVPQLLEIYREASGENHIRIMKTYSEQNSANKQTVRLVLEDIERLFPAKSYGLILFSHASGWLPKGALTQPESAQWYMGAVPLSIRTPIRTYTVVMDGTMELGLSEFASAIPDGFFDFIVFEACFMAGIEVLYELKDKTVYILSSSAEIVSPGFTPVYPGSLPLLFEPQADLVGFAKAFFDFWDGQIGDYRSATITVAKTTALHALAAWVKKHNNINVSEDILPEVQHFDRYRGHRLFFDFGDYYQRKTLAGTQNELNVLLKNTVVFKAATPGFIPNQFGFEIEHHSGITTYIRQERFKNLNEKYEELAWNKATQAEH